MSRFISKGGGGGARCQGFHSFLHTLIAGETGEAQTATTYLMYL